MGQINARDLDRLLKDSKEATITALDELCFFRLVIRCLIQGFSYDEALSFAHEQLEKSINDE